MPEDKTKTSETKIVKAEPKKAASKEGNSSKVQIRAVDVAIIEAQRQKAKKQAQVQAQKPEPKVQPKAAPAGKPMPKNPQTSQTARPMPFGKPMPKNAVPKKKNEVPQKPVEETAEAVKTAVIEEVKETSVKADVSIKENVAEAPKTEIKEPEIFDDGQKIPGVKIIKKAEPKAAAQEKPVAVEKPANIGDKAAPKTEKQAPKEENMPTPKKEEPKIDYTPGIGLKIISRAADQPKEAPKPKEKRQDRPEKRKPKEFVGKKGQDKNKTQEKTSPRKKDFQKAADGKVVAYTAPAGSDNRRKKKNKGKEFEREVYDYNPEALVKTEKKKHSKYKEKVEEPVESAIEIEAKETNGIIINCPITVAGFCEQVEKSTSEVVMKLMKMGIMANVNQNLDEETAVLLGMELGLNILVNTAEEVVLEEGIDTHQDAESELKHRAPIVTVMGHVDHGKTSLLDAVRKTNVTAGEAGGITQAIGASEVVVNGQKIVFLDTPGHEAFTAMRARGAHVTDIAVLVVAADDSVMPQTIESISHAKAAGVPIIVAINKIDKPGANIDNVKKDLANNGVLVEDWGGNVIAVPVSAKKGTGIQQLLEMILLQAEMLELKANPDRLASGTVIEARLDKNKGPVATLLVMNGTLQAGSAVVCGMASGRIRVMTDFKGTTIRKAGPATAVEITGLTDVPEAGDEFYMVKDEKTAREIAESRRMKQREEVLAKNSSTSLEKLFSQLQEGEVKDLNIIIKADVQGSVGALEQSLEKLHNESVRVKIVHTGVGAINESDVMLASTSDAIIIGFNVRPSTAVTTMAEQSNVEIRTYRIIYEIIEDIEAAMKGMLKPEFKEVILGKVEVRDTFKVPNVGIIAGAYVIEGKVTRNASVRLVRDGIVIHEGTISSLKRFKDDAKEVAAGFECGIGIEKFNDIKIGDIIEAYTMEEVKRD